MNYSNITEEQLNKKFRAAPEKIKTLLESEKTQSEVAHICEANRLDEERSLIVSQLAGLVLLGFVSEQMISGELGEQAHINFLHANAIAKELSEKVFFSVSEELKAVYKPNADSITPTTLTDAMSANEGEREDETEISINKETADLIDARIKEGEEEKEGGVDNWIKKLKRREDQPVLLYEEKVPEARDKGFTKFSLPFGLFAKKATAPVIPLKAEIESGDGERKTIGEIVGRDEKSRGVEELKNAMLKTQARANDANKNEEGLGIKDKERGEKESGKIWGLKREEKRVVHYSGARTPILAYEDDLFEDTMSTTGANAGNANEEKESRKTEELKNATRITQMRANDANEYEEGLRIKDKEREGEKGEKRDDRQETEKKNEEKDGGKNEFKGRIQKPRPMTMGNTVYLK